MDYKGKYEQALDRAKDWAEGKALPAEATTEDILKYIFPELKESEDERIRKAIVEALNSHCNSINILSARGYRMEDIEAWLEKQGENNKWKPSKNEMDALYSLSYITNKMDDKKDEAITKLYQDLKREFFSGVSYENMFPSSPVDAPIKLEKQGEQKSSDKVEPKFKVGDWINGYYTSYKVLSVNNEGYVVEDVDGNIINILFENEKFHHLWTIQDAKDGDVVVDKSDRTIGIFQSIGHHPDGGSYNDPSYCFLHCRYDDGFFYAEFERGNMIDADNLIPATKEQRDLLFQKMKEAGYEWDAEKKELKKIEQKQVEHWQYVGTVDLEKDEENPKPAEWSDDERIRKALCDIVRDMPYMETELRAHGLTVEKTLAYLEKQKAKEDLDRMAPIYEDLESFESALEKAWKFYNDSGARTVDSCEDNYIECAFSKGFREGFLYKETQKERKDYHKLYEDIAQSEWFKKAYVGKSLGEEFEQKEQIPYEPKNWPADKDNLTQEQKPAEWSEEGSEKEKEAEQRGYERGYERGYPKGYEDGRYAAMWEHLAPPPTIPPYTPPYQPITTPVEPYYGYRVTCTTTSNNVQTNNDEHHEEEK